jgi:hypothetical protein
VEQLRLLMVPPLAATFYAQPADGNTVTIGSLGITGITQLRMWLGKNNSGDPWGTLTLNATNVTSFLTTNYPSLTSTGQWIDLTSQLPGSTLSTITMTSPVANTDVRLSAVEVNGIVLIDRAASTTAGNDSLVDTPTSISATDTGVGGEIRGNYCTWNPLNAQLGAGSVSNGNLDFTGPSGSANYNFIGGTFAIDTSSTSGWYFEFTQTTYGNGAMVSLLDTGFQASALSNQGAIGYSGTNSTAGISYANEGSIHNYGSTTSGLTSWTSSGDIISIAIKNNKIWFAKNGTWISGSPSAETSPSITLASTKYVTPAAGGINSSVISLNAGQRAFAYTAPSGFKALCDTNLGAPLVAKPNTLMDVALWTGTGATQSITGVGFNPDFLWIKSRNGSGYNHHVYDSVRGIDKFLRTNTTQSEFTVSPLDQVTSLNADGFTLGSDSASPGALEVNELNKTYVGWLWDAGTSTDPSNTAGSITSQVRANVSAGFSIVSWTGTSSSGTIGHGLNVAPALIIVKCRSTGGTGWPVYHQSLGGVDKVITLQSTAAVQTISNYWNTTAPSSTTFGVASGYDNNVNGATMIAYAFSPVVGYSAALSWTGNGSNDGPMIHCGFSPRFWIWKRTDSSGDWWMIDTARSNTGNPVDEWLAANRSDAEYPNDGDFDFLSNGIKIRTTSTSVNASGGSYIGFAWASNPFQYARAQ